MTGDSIGNAGRGRWASHTAALEDPCFLGALACPLSPILSPSGDCSGVVGTRETTTLLFPHFLGPPGTTRGRGQQPGSLYLVLQTLLNRAHHAHRSGSLKFTFVISKEKGFLYRLDWMHKTTDGLFNLLKKPTSGFNECVFSGIFAHLCPLGVLGSRCGGRSTEPQSQPGLSWDPVTHTYWP